MQAIRQKQNKTVKQREISAGWEGGSENQR
jgi:hypothetical protein